MTRTITCHHCGKTVPLNPRLKKKQTYCSAQECQQTRRSARKKERYQNDTVYRKKHLKSQQAWRRRRPSHQYQGEYRESHPEYVVRNRELQCERNKRRQRDPSLLIVNGTSFLAHLQILSKQEAILVKNSV